MSMQKPSPYVTQRKNTNLAISWFFIGAAFIGVGSYLATQGPSEQPQNATQMMLIFGGMALLLMVIGIFAGVLPAVEATNAKDLDSSEKVRSKYFIAGAFFELAAIVGIVSYFLTKTWYVYAFSMVALAVVTFAVLVPLCNKLYDRLELMLQRTKDGGQTVATKKTTYEL
ncbi:hypothetical protein QPK87_18380 [Kamptonema cortianum]|nr:hypothetical protein [Geitlerinema splendidum]MDK3158525.1 hypothetical protein [Kamptonema cortianum]